MAARVPAPDDDELRRFAAVGDFVELWHADRDAGVERSLVDYLARFPGHEEAVAREFLALGAPLPAAGEAVPRGDDGERIGPYRLLRLLGQGGQGAVWLAEDPLLRRTVALKVLASRSAPVLRGQVERLRREAQALAKLAHPGICAIHEAVLEGPRPYLAMQWIDGENLAALLLRRAQAAVAAPAAPDDVPAWIGFFAAAADALQAAHALGVLHRDVKPGNLMRTTTGQPVLLDFGLARDTDGNDLTLTQSGEVFGTLPYMAPEVLAGRRADARSDVYGLAATMYEVLAGRRPFAAPSAPALRAEIERGDPPPLLHFAPVTAELSLVLTTALERDPGRRYGSAAAFAEDLRRVAAGTPVAARPVELRTRLWRAVLRHPVWATGSALLAVGLVVALALLGQLTREQQQLGREQAQLAREQKRLLALRNAYRALQLAESRPGLALTAATEAARQEQNPEITEVLYRVLDRCFEEHALGGAASDSPWLSLTPDGQWLARAGERDITVLATATREIVRRFPVGATGSGATIAAVDDSAVVFAGADGVLRHCDLLGVERGCWQLHAPVENCTTVAHIAVAPDRRHVATAGSDGGVAIVDLSTGSVLRGVGHNGGVGMVVFAPAGDRLASVSGNFNRVAPGDYTVRVFATATGELLQTSGPHPRPVNWCSWSSDGRLLAIAREERGVEVRAMATGAVVAEIDHAKPVEWVGFAPGDRQLAIGSPAGLTIHDLASGRQLVQHTDFGDRSVYRGAFSPDGQQLAVIAWDDTARVYDASTWTLRRLLRGVRTRPRGLLWKGDSSRLYTIGGDLQSWYPRERPFLPTAFAGSGRLVDAGFLPDGASLVAATDDGTVTVHDAERGSTLATIAAGVPLRRVLGLRDGRLLLIAPRHPPRLADRTHLLDELGSVPATMGWQADDGALVLAGSDGSVRIYESDGRLRHTVACHGAAITCARLHPERPWLLSGAEDRTIALCDLRTGTTLLQQELWPHQVAGRSQSVYDVAFAGDAEAIVVGADQQVRAIALPSGQVRCAVAVGPTAGFVLPSTDGRSVLVGGQWSGRLKRLASEDLRILSARNSRHLNMLVTLAKQPGGRLALSASKDGAVNIFVEGEDEAIGTIRATEDVLVTASFSPDGHRILTADVRGRIRIWPVDPLPLALAVRPQQTADENDLR